VRFLAHDEVFYAFSYTQVEESSRAVAFEPVPQPQPGVTYIEDSGAFGQSASPSVATR
jgi:hypothetical protein